MARIDANVATQLNDASRPHQAVRDTEAQVAEARRAEAAKSEPRTLTPATTNEVKAAAERLQQVIEVASGRQLDFTVNEQFKELVVKISDRKSGEVLKEIPSKDFMKLRARLHDLIGMFIDEKA